MSQTRTIFVALIAICLLAGGCSFNLEGIKPSKNYITRNYKVSDFDKLEISTIGEVYFIQSTDGTVSAQAYGPDNVIEAIEVSKDGNTLVMLTPKKTRFRGNVNTKITITAPSLSEFNFRGVGNVHIEDGIKADRFEISNHGVGDVKINKAECNDIKVNSTGVGNVKINGTAVNASLTSQGVGDIDASDLKCEKVDASANGVGNINCYATETISASAKGVGNISYKGSPVHKNIRKSGIGSVKED